MSNNKNISRLRTLITTACVIGGFLAGGNVYRYIIEVPAWRNLNVVEWAEYSRNADLKNGLFLFPFEAIVPAILLLAASVIIIRNKNIFQVSAFWIHAGTVLALFGLALTFLAAPYMLSLKTSGNNPEMLQQIFDRFHFWGLLRAMAQILSFFACVIALGKIYSIKSN